MKVAAVQFSPQFKAPEQNIALALDLVSKAAQGGAKLIVLPELCTSGYSFMSTDEARPFAEILTQDPGVLKRMADEKRPNSVGAMREAAMQFGAAIAWGLVEEDPGTGDLYNSQMLVLPTGEWISYRKVNQWANDYLWSVAGTGSPPIRKFMGKDIGLLVCADVRDKSDSIDSFYESGDANIVAFSSNWGKGGFPAGKWVKFAKANHCTLVASNRYGQEQNNDFGNGGICIIEPSGKVHCKGLVWDQPCMVFAEVP